MIKKKTSIAVKNNCEKWNFAMERLGECETKEEGKIIKEIDELNKEYMKLTFGEGENGATGKSR